MNTIGILCRKYCGLPGATGWDDLFGSMNNITVKRYAQIYVHPQDIDLWSGGVSERPLPGAMVGPTFACIIASQFSNSRRGDRFWYELGGHPHSFTTDQLAEIRKARLARIVCDNTDLIDTIQLYPMVLPDHEMYVDDQMMTLQIDWRIVVKTKLSFVSVILVSHADPEFCFMWI
jgi:peroxidase